MTSWPGLAITATGGMGASPSEYEIQQRIRLACGHGPVRLWRNNTDALVDQWGRLCCPWHEQRNPPAAAAAPRAGVRSSGIWRTSRPPSLARAGGICSGDRCQWDVESCIYSTDEGQGGSVTQSKPQGRAADAGVPRQAPWPIGVNQVGR